MGIQKVVNRRRTGNTMIKRKRQRTIYKALHRKLKIEQHAPTKTGGEPSANISCSTCGTRCVVLLTNSSDEILTKYQVRVITVFTVFRLLTDFVCLYNYEFGLSLCKIVRSSVILLLPLFRVPLDFEFI